MKSTSLYSNSNEQWIYDVFINFRGEDTRKNFVSHLHAALANLGVNTFLDSDNLLKEKELRDKLVGAIESSHISIVVFSENYTESSWCLYELEKILECRTTYGHVVFPVFYNIDPSVVRHQTGEFGKALELRAKKMYHGNGVVDALSDWKSLLNQAANLSGWDANNFRNEAELVKSIVKEVLAKLDSSHLSITEYPVGLEPRIQEVIEFIDDQSNIACMAGIWGMGGSGKTTTAKAIYNQIHRKFEDRSFIENIREVCEKDNDGIIRLQEQLLSDVLKVKVKKIHSITSGTTMIEKRLVRKKVLVVLDDVSTFEQIKALCGNRKWFASGSVLIVTTRDVHLLKLLKVAHVCTMKEMDEDDSLELFCWHAFREPIPRKYFGKLSRNVVAYCGGLPLALEVLGSYLYERTIREWESVLSKLERIPNDQVQEKLKISYDGLEDDMEKDIFLDICCFFIGKDRAYVAKILNGCGLYADIGITVLVERSLVKVEKNNKLGMHDLLRDMGREIVRQSSAKNSGNRSRLWFHEDVHDVLTKNMGTETVEGLVFKSQRTDRVCFNTNSFKEMKKLRLLQLDSVDLIGDYGCLSNQLRWVKWQGFTSFNYIPDDFYQRNLVAIDLKHSNITQVWNEMMLLEKLEILNLSHCKYLRNSPDFSKLPNLEKLIMKDCPNLSDIHPSVGDLNRLVLINLKDCTSLNNLPKKIYQLKSLKTLILSGCSMIDNLEEEVVQMESLTTLIAKDTGVKEVPYSIVRSKNIAYISLCGFEGLARDVFPSLIWSWMSPTMNPLPRISPFGNMALSVASINVQNNNLGFLSPMVRSLSQLRTVCIQCRSKIQLTQELQRILDDQYDVNLPKSETSNESQISNLSSRSLLIRMGSCHIGIDTLGKSISQGLTAIDSSDFFLPGGNYHSWLAYKGKGPSALFEVPDHQTNGIILRVVYSSISENMGVECLTSFLIINYTKCTVKIYKRDTVMSFNSEDWKGLTSNLVPGDEVEIFLVFGHGLIVKEIAVYLIYDQSISVEVDLSEEVKLQPWPKVDMQPSLNVKAEASTDAKTSFQKFKESIFTRLPKIMRTCLGLNEHGD
ncbi:disease resistance protein RUN1 isoform X2 [Lathyrus oleraceus]|uniref:disease resistance protein RUN1 isoform X2 n=1 Tax=Pisum sativum TaxID=3888 RepID=UPI0021CE2BF4|nr:disease resistance protein RUN1-like isoform X2 [Pisum sativum]